jgi:tRNA (5-methylaminomethyl-2-thiouridylate)-methyltransferase
VRGDAAAVYLDHAATTPLAPEALAAMQAALAELGGNPSSVHAAGRRARAAVEEARRDVAALLGADAEEIVFTSGGTEGDNLAIRGLALAARARRPELGARGGHVISSPLEHPAVHGALAELEREGFAVTRLPVDARGAIDPDALRAALRPDTLLVSLAAANHEIGNRYDIAAFAALAHAAGALFHTDAVQAAGKIALELAAAGVDAATVSAHKLHGPKGVGALYVRRGVDLHPLLAGGHQERERRPGTENSAGIVGFGRAARLARAGLADAAPRLEALRDRLERGLLAVPGARRHGGERAPGITSVAFDGAPGQLVAIGLDLEGICVSTGAACTSGSLQPSPVLLALGLPPARAAEAIRISVGRTTTDAEIDRLLDVMPGVVARVRARGEALAAGAAPPRRASRPRPRVVVAMSGGVDSSTAAALLVESGADVVGVTLKLYDAAGTSASVGGRCCGPRDIEDARATAAALGFPHYVVDETAAFKASVIDDFVGQHRAGRTPNPCVRCNERLKFAPLVQFADAVGADALATGHYARLAPPSGADAGDDGAPPRLLRAVDRDKDQSYFLFGVRPEVLARVLFPLGDRTKDEVRAIARRAGLPNADKPDSQQICFIPDGDHRRYVEARGGAGPAGAIRDEAGAALGAHAGTHHFTVGQRRGVPAAAGGARRFVLRVEPATGDVVVGPRESLARRALRVSDVRWMLARDDARWPLRCAVQIRHHAPAAPAWIAAPPDGDGAVTVDLDAPAMGVAPGQAAVFYDGEAVLGGGWID